MSLEKKPFTEAVRLAKERTMRTYSPRYLILDVLIMVAIIAAISLVM